MGKHTEVVVGNWYDSEKYFKLRPGMQNSPVRYSTAGDKLSFSVNFIPKGGFGPNPGAQHSHPHEQCLIVPVGDGDAIVDGKYYPTEPGFFALIPPNMPHGYDTSKATHTSWNLDIFNPPRHEYLKDNYYALLMSGKDPMKDFIVE